MTQVGPKRVEAIVREMASLTGVPEDDILGNRRFRTVVRVRHLTIWAYRDATGASLGEIGRAFNRDHTSVQNALRRVEEIIKREGDHIAMLLRAIAIRAGVGNEQR